MPEVVHGGCGGAGPRAAAGFEGFFFRVPESAPLNVRLAAARKQKEALFVFHEEPALPLFFLHTDAGVL